MPGVFQSSVFQHSVFQVGGGIPLVLGSDVLDSGLNTFALANKLLVCSAVPTTYATANANALGVKNWGIGNVFAAIASWSSGRQVTSFAITDGAVSVTGNAVCWAVIDDANSRLLATGPTNPSTVHVTNGEVFALDSFVIDESASSSSLLDSVLREDGFHALREDGSRELRE